MEGDFLKSVYWEEWYNNGTDLEDFPCPGFPDHDKGKNAQMVYISFLKS